MSISSGSNAPRADSKATESSPFWFFGLGSIEFGREIIKRLDIFSETDIQEWFDMYKHGEFQLNTKRRSSRLLKPKKIILEIEIAISVMFTP